MLEFLLFLLVILAVVAVVILSGGLDEPICAYEYSETLQAYMWVCK